jgi:hypothetical protein
MIASAGGILSYTLVFTSLQERAVRLRHATSTLECMEPPHLFPQQIEEFWPRIWACETSQVEKVPGDRLFVTCHLPTASSMSFIVPDAREFRPARSTASNATVMAHI